MRLSAFHQVRASRPSAPTAVAVLGLGISWTLMWAVDSFWGPLFFFGTWVSATVIVYSVGPEGYLGWRVHLAFSALSVPMWWWFELINARVDNWQYLRSVEYSAVEYTLFASLVFSTVGSNSPFRVETAPQIRPRHFAPFRVRPSLTFDLDQLLGGRSMVDEGFGFTRLRDDLLRCVALLWRCAPYPSNHESHFSHVVSS